MCGVRFVKDRSLPEAAMHTCPQCAPYPILADFADRYCLIVDGSFLQLSGRRDVNELGHGGAGLVLVGPDDRLMGGKACGFDATSSSDAELQAMKRGARWAPHVCILTDDQGQSSRRVGEMRREIRWLPGRQRSKYFEMAHELSVQGRIRAETDWIKSTIESFSSPPPGPER